MQTDPSCSVIKLGILGDSPTQFLCQVLKDSAGERGLTFDIFEAGIDQINQQILAPDSELHQFEPQYILIFESVYLLRDKFYDLAIEDRKIYAELYSNRIKSLYQIVASSGARLICFTFPSISDGVFGNYGYKTKLSFSTQLTRINSALSDLANELKDLFIIDLASVVTEKGLSTVTQRNIYISYGLIFKPDFFVIIAKHVIDQILAIIGKFKKCLILDLDNTIWGGTIGDDGIDNIQIGTLGTGRAFSELQTWAKELKRRGIILAICSKNTESVATEPFEKHPNMVLHLSDITVFMANWDNKVNNIRHIQSILNIGFDSMVFLDDDPFERNIVRSNIPDIVVPELPEHPEEYLPFLISHNFFESGASSSQDENRTVQYQEQIKRETLKKLFLNEKEFLASLGMTSDVEVFHKFSIPRIVQLIQRSNQYNLRTVRYSEEDIVRIAASKDHIAITFTLQDKFGDYGLIAVLILQEKEDSLFVDTWLMSCRVMKRGLENFILNNLIEIAKKDGFQRIVGEYVPSGKNQIVQNHYKELGFKYDGNYWILQVNNYADLSHTIRRVS